MSQNTQFLGFVVPFVVFIAEFLTVSLCSTLTWDPSIKFIQTFPLQKVVTWDTGTTFMYLFYSEKYQFDFWKMTTRNCWGNDFGKSTQPSDLFHLWQCFRPEWEGRRGRHVPESCLAGEKGDCLRWSLWAREALIAFFMEIFEQFRKI